MIAGLNCKFTKGNEEWLRNAKMMLPQSRF